MLKMFIDKPRKVLLRITNTYRLKRCLSQESLPGKTLVFYVLTRDIVHMTPLAISIQHPSFQPVLISNGLREEDLRWLREMVGEVPIFNLLTSLTGNPFSLLDHGTVIQLLMDTNFRSFCIQDPDCFITDNSFFDTVRLDYEGHYAAGPFTKGLSGSMRFIPDTFFLYLNAPMFRDLHARYGLHAMVNEHAPKKLACLLEKAGFHAGVYPEQFKGYFDTLQMFWIAARQLGACFNLIPGAGNKIFHIGGTSYLSRSLSDLSHWDFWPLNVHYFNLKLLSLPKCEIFRERFQSLFEWHDNAENLLKHYPEYKRGWRFSEVCRIVKDLDAAKIYS